MGKLFFSGIFISTPKVNGIAIESGYELSLGDTITFESGFLVDGPTRCKVKVNSDVTYNGSQKPPMSLSVSEDITLKGTTALTTVEVNEDRIYTQVINVVDDVSLSKQGATSKLGLVAKAGNQKYLTRINYDNETYFLKDIEARELIPDTVAYDTTNGLTIGTGDAQSPKVFIKTINGNAVVGNTSGDITIGAHHFLSAPSLVGGTEPDKSTINDWFDLGESVVLQDQYGTYFYLKYTHDGDKWEFHPLNPTGTYTYYYLDDSTDYEWHSGTATSGGGITVGTLTTNATTTQAPSASESFTGSITLHKISKTGSYNDLLNIPSAISSFTITEGTITANQVIPDNTQSGN